MNTNNAQASSEVFGVRYNNTQSSLQYFNFEGMDKDKIIEKYEQVLFQREKQIREIAYEIGILNEKLFNAYEKLKNIEEENRILQGKILRKNTLLEQELTNKEIMFIKISNLQDENDKFMKILQAQGIDISDYSGKNISKLEKISRTGNDRNKKESQTIKEKVAKSNNNITSVLERGWNTNNTQSQTEKGKDEKVSREKGHLTSLSLEGKMSKRPNKNIGDSMMNGSIKRLASEDINYEPVF